MEEHTGRNQAPNALPKVSGQPDGLPAVARHFRIRVTRKALRAGAPDANGGTKRNERREDCLGLAGSLPAKDATAYKECENGNCNASEGADLRLGQLVPF